MNTLDGANAPIQMSKGTPSEAQSPRGSKAKQNKSAIGASVSNNSIQQKFKNGNKKISAKEF